MKLKDIYNLTEKESQLFQSILTGMDYPGMGWLHALAEESLSTNAVLGSLIKKGLVTSQREKEPGLPEVFWIELTTEGKEFLNS